MLQSCLHDRQTRHFLTDAGITPGMTVLDIGSGADDVAFAAADIVGPHGRVIGIDLNPVILETARAAAEGRRHVTFIAGDCRDVEAPQADAVVDRFVLFYIGDITETLRVVTAWVKAVQDCQCRELDIDILAERAQAEVRATGYPLIFLPMVTAWA